MAQTKDLIVTSGVSGGTNTKTFIRIGDTSPSTVDVTGSSIQFLQDLSTINKSFDNAGDTSAFRIRHDTVNGALIFQGRSGSYGPYRLMTLNDDTSTVTFGGTVNFQDITFDQITGSHLYIGTSSQLLGTTSIVNANKSTQIYSDALGNLVFENQGNSVIYDGVTMSFSGSGYTQTASIWYDGTEMHIDGFTSGGNSWKTQYMLTASYLSTSVYTIYTESVNQIIEHYPYLSVYLNGTALIQSSSIRPHWDYKSGGNSSSIQFRYNIPYSPQDQFYLSYVYNGGSV